MTFAVDVYFGFGSAGIIATNKTKMRAAFLLVWIVVVFVCGVQRLPREMTYQTHHYILYRHGQNIQIESHRANA